MKKIIFISIFVLVTIFGNNGCRSKPIPKIKPEQKYINLLLENAFKYIAPTNKMIDPVSGYPVEGWNHDPPGGLFLRSFTQLTAIGEWIEVLANIASGNADNRYISKEQALEKLNHTITTLLQDQKDPKISAKGLLVNFLDISTGKRLGPLASNVDKKDFTKMFGKVRGEKIWEVLKVKKWIISQNKDKEASVIRNNNYGSEKFDGALKSYDDTVTKNKIMGVLDKRVVMIIFGDNANLSSSIAKSIGALLHPEIRNETTVLELRKKMENFLENQKEGYEYLYDDNSHTISFGYNATTEKLVGWNDAKGKWVIGQMNYLVNEFRGPEMFVVLRFKLPSSAIKNLSFKIKSYQLLNKKTIYTLAPWEGSSFQMFGLSLFMQELKDPSWKVILKNAVDIELDYSYRNKLPGFLSESYTGSNSQYSGSVGIPDIAVVEDSRITNAASLYTLGVSYMISPDKTEKFLKDNWGIISKLLTYHGPWEGYNTSDKKAIKYQTAAHTLSFILGVIGTAPENMLRYLESKKLTKKLEELYKTGEFINLSTNQIRIKNKIIFTVTHKDGANLSGGILKIRYRSHEHINHSVICFERTENSLAGKPPMDNEILLKFENTKGKEKEIQIPLPAVPGLSEIQNVVIIYNEAGEEFPEKFSITGFEFVPFN